MLIPVSSGNLFADIPAELPEELETLLVQGRQFRLKRIVSRGHGTDWYDQDENEWVILLSGGAVLEFDDEPPLTLNSGDYLFIPARKKHRLSWTHSDQNSVWLALYFDTED